MTTDLLEERLTNLALTAPDPGTISARVLAPATRRRGRRLPRVALSAAATMVLLAMVAYFVPAADNVVAKVPFAGDLLRDAGLAGVEGRITSVGSVAASSGYRLTLVGAYADSSRTVLLLHATPAVGPHFPSIRLTDQFGRSYDAQNGSADFKTGDSEIQFEALAWPDAITGSRITLQLTNVEIDSETGPVQTVPGTWTLSAIVGVDQGTNLPLPASATLGDAHFQFTSASYTPATVAVNIDETGVSFHELSRIVPDGGKGTPALTMDIYDPNGQIISGSASASDDPLGVVHISFLGFRLDGAGNYVLRVSYAGQGSFERVLKIP